MYSQQGATGISEAGTTRYVLTYLIPILTNKLIDRAEAEKKEIEDLYEDDGEGWSEGDQEMENQSQYSLFT